MAYSDRYIENQIRYKMDPDKLDRIVKREGSERVRYLFNKNIWRDEQGEAHFWNEITALKAYVHARLKLSNSTNWPQKERFKKHGARDMMTYLSVGQALDKLSKERLSLLVEYYILEKSSKEMTEEMGIDNGCFGGKLSQAKQALKKALGDLIPHRNPEPRKIEPFTPPTEAELLKEKREKVSRMLIRRQQ